MHSFIYIIYLFIYLFVCLLIYLFIQAYAESCPDMLSLNEAVHASEDLLTSLEETLKFLCHDLGLSGGGTEAVAATSLSLATKANNRQEICLLLSTYLDQIAVTRGLVAAICKTNLNENTKPFLQALKHLAKKIEHAQQPGMKERKSVVSIIYSIIYYLYLFLHFIYLFFYLLSLFMSLSSLYCFLLLSPVILLSLSLFLSPFVSFYVYLSLFVSPFVSFYVYLSPCIC